MKAVNLIPNDQRRAQSSGAQAGSSYIVIGVLVTLLAMVAGYVVTSNKVTQSKNDAAAAKAEADSLEAEVAQRGSFTNFSQIKEMRLASVSGVAGTRFDWERLMRELSRVMPSGSWLQTTDASVTGEVAGAEATTPVAGTAAVASEPRWLHASPVGCRPDDGAAAPAASRLRRGAEPVQHRAEWRRRCRRGQLRPSLPVRPPGELLADASPDRGAAR
jgi:hypothetical protein